MQRPDFGSSHGASLPIVGRAMTVECCMHVTTPALTRGTDTRAARWRTSRPRAVLYIIQAIAAHKMAMWGIEMSRA